MENKTTFWNYIKENIIEIPIIQRDYAQGRLGEETLRKNFLRDLKKHLDDKDNAEIKLDFVYGSVENDKINPLDGQQRLTTLWLLHWYIALRAKQLNEDTCKYFRNFTYETRISSREFCRNLCNPTHFEDFKGGDIVGFITSRTWFYYGWKQDPTIQSMLGMLGGTKGKYNKNEDIIDGLENLFKDTPDNEYNNKYWNKLISDRCPIVFYHLSLEDFGQTDDLYIKMNARGKQLTSFENFKADLIGYITEQSNTENEERKKWKSLLDETDGLPIKLDTTWTDIFWKNKSQDNKIDAIYYAFINRFFLSALICQKNDNKDYCYSAVEIEKNSCFSYLYGIESDDSKIKYDGISNYQYLNGCIPYNVFAALRDTLNNFIDVVANINDYFPKWVNSKFQFIPKYNGNTITTLGQKERVVFFAVCRYFEKGRFDGDTFKRWMRVVWNIVENTNIGVLSMIAAMRLIDELSEGAHNIYEYLADENLKILSDAVQEQVKEEVAKAKQIVNSGSEWEPKIIEAEKYAFFKGAIRFLFTDGGKNIKWIDFDTKWNNVKSLIPANKDNRSTIKTIISFYKDDDVKELFSQVTLSNYDTNLRLLLLSFPSKVHEILKNPENKSETSLLKEHLILLCEQCPDYWLHLDWGSENEFVILSNYEKRGGYYRYYSYVVGSDFFQNRLNLLNQLFIENKIDVPKVWKGLFIEFEYKNHKFRWQLKDWVDMYDDHMNNLWKDGLHSNYNGNNQHSFKDAETLKNELDRCIKEYQDLKS